MCKGNYINLQTKEVLDLEKVSALPDNAMLKVKPELWIEWDFERNNELGLNVWKMTKSNKSYSWWICKSCNKKWDVRLYKRMEVGSCPYCTLNRIDEDNSLFSMYPVIFKELHSDYNNLEVLKYIHPHSNKTVWWKCNKCSSSYDMPIKERTVRNSSCPYCAGHRVNHTNSLDVLYPYLSAIWNFNKNKSVSMSEITKGYSQKVWWKCSCGHEWDALVSNVIRNKLCPKCSLNRSSGERIIISLLDNLKVGYKLDEPFNWSEKRRYDFYLPNQNLIIEVHGKQHYERGFESMGGRSLEEEQFNDEYKKELALLNGVANYIIINASNTEKSFFTKEIIKSGLTKWFNISNIDWDGIYLESIKNHDEKIKYYLNLGYDLAWIENNTKISKRSISKFKPKKKPKRMTDFKEKIVKGRAIVRINMVNDEIEEFVNIVSVASQNNYDRSTISKVCRGKQKSAYGYKWMYKEEYEKYIEEQNSKLA